MVRRRKTKRRRARKTFGLLSALEAYTYGALVSEAVMGTTPWGFLSGEPDIGLTPTGNPALETYAGSGMQLVGVDQISLADIMKSPAQAFGAMSSNLQSSIIPLAIKSATVAFGFRFAKRVLRRPLSSIQRNIVKPMLGPGISVR